ncbi:MAG: hypothetical protein MMC23_007608 [Stictis urceolatum]|nr:hypothetical protein [Stictis urceolata]
MSAAHETQEPQRTGSDRADSEWKASAGLDNLTHGSDNPGSEVDRSSKAAPMPEDDPGHETPESLAGGSGSAITGSTGSGKGPLHPEEEGTKKQDARN